LARRLFIRTPMTPLPAPFAHSRPIVRWQLEKDNRAVICGIEAPLPGVFDVVFAEHRSGVGASFERFDEPGPALLRHAFLASALREQGWRVTSHSW
jgi:hypothetical protein